MTAVFVDSELKDRGLRTIFESGRSASGGDRTVRYYFDVFNSEGLAIDDEGLDLPTVAAAQAEAAKSLADRPKAVWDAFPATHQRCLKYPGRADMLCPTCDRRLVIGERALLSKTAELPVCSSSLHWDTSKFDLGHGAQMRIVPWAVRRGDRRSSAEKEPFQHSATGGFLRRSAPQVTPCLR